ncbi:DUF3237 domain-containing protein [Leptolyngbya sp. NIES-2104]|uniref:DUF3237 domain-containing protein n=1 Tax=Leptolyngbya sp. NIES-2104 TaxID=1552121 RepID=UPI0006ECBF5D|nr:DUF3237 domain-containing protein [Leptolyngbya sp. NIES-2104]GAP97989.1 hypothetical protein NIES2104_45420 [Leptolyngbya sp. NIES-2104]
MLTYSLEPIFSYHLQLDPPEILGPVPDGFRANAYVKSGTITGEKLHGILRSGGGDWFTIRPDGVAITDVRGTIETQDGALIYLTYTGVMDLGEDGYQNFLNGHFPPTAKIHTTPRLQTAHPTYQWLNRVQCVGVAVLDFATFEGDFEVYALR